LNVPNKQTLLVFKMLHKLYSAITIAVLFSIIASCSSIEIFKENTEIPIFTDYRSFVIINQEIGMKGFNSQIIDQEVQIHIQKALESQGLVYNKINPDLLIRYTSNEDERERQVTNNFNSFPMWGYRIWDPWAFNPYNPMMRNQSGTTQYELLQVIVDFIDPKKDKYLMTLTGVTELTSQKSKPRIVLKTTDKILARFLLDLNFEAKQ
jgi:hypothetical protein